MVAPESEGVGERSVQAAAVLVQKHMRAHNGTCLQLRCDEKGFLAVCAFGLPGQTHGDDPARALLAALSIVHDLEVLIIINAELPFYTPCHSYFTLLQ